MASSITIISEKPLDSSVKTEVSRSAPPGSSIFDKIISRNVITIIVVGIILLVAYIFLIQALDLTKSAWNSEAFWNTCHFWLFLVFAMVTNLSFLEAFTIMLFWEFVEAMLNFMGWHAFYETCERKYQNILADLAGFMIGSGLKMYLRPSLKRL